MYKFNELNFQEFIFLVAMESTFFKLGSCQGLRPGEVTKMATNNNGLHTRQVSLQSYSADHKLLFILVPSAVQVGKWLE